MYNVEKWIPTTIQSIRKQTYNNFQAIVIDDMSTDNSFLKAQESIQDDKRFVLLKNKEKHFALHNIIRGIKKLSPNGDDVIVTIDGDDWLPNQNVLTKIANTYKTKECFLTYGTYMTYPNGQKPWNVTKYHNDIIKQSGYRKDVWRASHLRTFKHFLWKNIDLKDLKDKDGNYYKMAWDLAFMFPMLEMAAERQEYLDDITYIYNRDNPINDDKVDHSYQLKLEKEIRARPKYKRAER